MGPRGMVRGSRQDSNLQTRAKPRADGELSPFGVSFVHCLSGGDTGPALLLPTAITTGLYAATGTICQYSLLRYLGLRFGHGWLRASMVDRPLKDLSELNRSSHLGGCAFHYTSIPQRLGCGSRI